MTTLPLVGTDEARPRDNVDGPALAFVAFLVVRRDEAEVFRAAVFLADAFEVSAGLGAAARFTDFEADFFEVFFEVFGVVFGFAVAGFLGVVFFADLAVFVVLVVFFLLVFFAVFLAAEDVVFFAVFFLVVFLDADAPDLVEDDLEDEDFEDLDDLATVGSVRAGGLRRRPRP